MDITLNGEPRTLDHDTTVIALLQAEGLAGRRVAVEVNGEIVPRSRHHPRQLAHRDIGEHRRALDGG